MSRRSPSDLPTERSTASFWHREPSSLLKGHRTTRHLPNRADIVIIGSGITGASIAHHIFNQDDLSSTNDWKPEVVMIEAREACWGATGRNGGHCQPLLFEHPYDASIPHFEMRNYDALLWLITKQDIDCEFIAQPGVRGIYGRENLFKVEQALSMVQQHAPLIARHMRLITAKEDLEHYRLDNADGAVWTDRAARLWPYKLVARLLEDILLDPNLNGRFNLQTLTPVDAIKQHSAGWTINTARGAIEADHVLLATNAYTSHLVPDFADLIVPCRGQMSALSPTPWLSGEQRLQTSLGFEGAVMDDYLIQRPSEAGGQLMFGGGRHLGPSLGVSDDSVIDKTVASYLRSTLPKNLTHGPGSTEAELSAQNEWTGIMGWSRDGLPWVGPVPKMDGLYLSAGYTGHGMPNAWLCGRALVIMLMEISHGASQRNAIAAAQRLTDLPEAYVVSPERMRAAMKLDFADNAGDGILC